MGSIDGINPVILDSIKVTAQKPAINKPQRSKVSEEKKDRDKEGRQSQAKLSADLSRLEKAVDKLNQLLVINKIPLYFQIAGENAGIKVKLISADHQQVISQLSPERILEMAVSLDTRGFTVDELI